MQIAYIEYGKSSFNVCQKAVETMLQNGKVANSPISNGGADLGGIFQKAMESALTNVIVIPLQHFITGVWNGVVECSFVVCCVIAVSGLVFMLCGIEKGRKWAIGSTITYTLIKIADAVIREG